MSRSLVPSGLEQKQYQCSINHFSQQEFTPLSKTDGFYETWKRDATKASKPKNRKYNDSSSREQRRYMRLHRLENLCRTTFRPLTSNQLQLTAIETTEQKKDNRGSAKLQEQQRTQQIKQQCKQQKFGGKRPTKTLLVPSDATVVELTKYSNSHLQNKLRLTTFQNNHHSFITICTNPHQKLLPHLVDLKMYTTIFSQTKTAIKSIKTILDWNMHTFQVGSNYGGEKSRVENVTDMKGHCVEMMIPMQHRDPGNVAKSPSPNYSSFEVDGISSNAVGIVNGHSHHQHAAQSKVRLDIVDSMQDVRITKRLLAKELQHTSSLRRAISTSPWSSTKSLGRSRSVAKRKSNGTGDFLGHSAENHALLNQLICAEIFLQDKEREADRLIKELKSYLDKMRNNVRRKGNEERKKGAGNFEKKNDTKFDHRLLPPRVRRTIGIEKLQRDYLEEENEPFSLSSRLFSSKNAAIGGLDGIRWRRRQKQMVGNSKQDTVTH